MIAIWIGISIPLAHMTFRLVWDEYTDVAFTRVGYFNESSATLWIRYPLDKISSEVEGGDEYQLDLYYREFDSNEEWTSGGKANLGPESDWVSHIHVTGLMPATSYEYAWVWKSNPNDKTGGFKILEFPQSGRLGTSDRQLGPLDQKRKFGLKTANPSANSLSFVFGSCIKPNFPYGQSLPGFDLIYKHSPDLFLMLGDFIYVDTGINFGNTVYNYQRLYREVLGQPESVKLLSSTPMMSIWDDHELLNNYESRKLGHVFDAASEVYERYLSSANPKTFSDMYAKYYTFEMASLPFFVLDTRTFRDSSASPPTMLGKTQLKRLLAWIQQQNSDWRFIVSSVPFTVNWRDNDTWRGYMEERDMILDAIRQLNDRNVKVIILSGDRHQLAVSEIIDEGDVDGTERLLATEFSVSPINMFGAPITAYWETENLDSNGAKLLDSKWIKDKQLFYGNIFGRTAVGWMKFTNDETNPQLIFCAFSRGTKVSHDELKACGSKTEAEIDGQRLVYIHTISASDDNLRAKFSEGDARFTKPKSETAMTALKRYFRKYF